MENLSQKQIDYSIAKERVKQLKKFYSSLAVFIIVFTIYCFRKYYYTQTKRIKNLTFQLSNPNSRLPFFSFF